MTKNLQSSPVVLDLQVFCQYDKDMRKNPPKKRGAPKKAPEKAKTELLQIRVSLAEKQAFAAAADLDGKKVSEWIRDRLRGQSRQELEQAGQAVPFLAGGNHAQALS
jgi:hypothetical protein